MLPSLGRRILAAAIALAGLLSADRDLAPLQAMSRLLSSCPELDREIVARSVTDDSTEWIATCRRLGLERLAHAQFASWMTQVGCDRARWNEVHSAHEAFEERICLGLAGALDFGAPLRGYRDYLNRPAEVRFELCRMAYELDSLRAHRSVPAVERLNRADEVRRRYLVLGDSMSAIRVDVFALDLELERGRPDLHLARLERAIGEARRYQDDFVLCSLLGVRGVLYRRAGNPDSMMACYTKARTLAHRHRFTEQYARILRFEAVHFQSTGHLAAAVDRFAQARRALEPLELGITRLHMQLEEAKFLTRIGCWERAERRLRVIPPLLRQHGLTPRSTDLEGYRYTYDRLVAAVALSRGDTARGREEFQRLLRRPQAVNSSLATAETCQEWIRGLAALRRWSDVLDVCGRALAACDSTRETILRPGFANERALALYRLGRYPEALRAVTAAETAMRSGSAADEETRQATEVLRAILEAEDGHQPIAEKHLRRELAALGDRLVERDAGLRTLLEREEIDLLHEACHQVCGFAPLAGYRFECLWRSLPGRRFDPGATVRLIDTARHAHGVPGPIDARLDYHLVYRFHQGRLLRWTATRAHVSLDTLSVDDRECRRLVTAALQLLQSEPARPGEWLGARSRDVLTELATCLLPAELASPGRRMLRVDITPDGPLHSLPFEALPALGHGRGLPLAAIADVAYSHGVAAARPGQAGLASVVGAPEIPDDLRESLGLPDRPTLTEPEVSAVRSAFGDVSVLRGPQVTRERVLESWRRAPFIYLAAHHVRDPDAPFVGFVPMTPSPAYPSGAARIEIPDVESLDLSGCRLAVLAACATGATYAPSPLSNTSLGTAFLDAGATAVVQSAWDVDNVSTSGLMRSFLDGLGPSGDARSALAGARRRIAATPEGASPRVWAAWSLHRRIVDANLAASGNRRK